MDAWRTEAVCDLVNAGYGEHLLFSQDICMKFMRTKYGGFGYANVLETAVPRLLNQGLAREQIDGILIENPKRMLTFVEPEEWPRGSRPRTSQRSGDRGFNTHAGQKETIMKKTVIDSDIGEDIEKFRQSERVEGLPHSRGVVVHEPTHKRVLISGTAPVGEDGTLVGRDDAAEQTRFVIEQIRDMLAEFGGDLNDVVRVSVHLADVSEDEYLDITEVREEFFEKDHYPASVLNRYERHGLDGMKVEMDVDAIIPDDGWEVETA